MDLRDLSEMGERTLGIWAAQVGISANKSDPDKTGWDFFLELPLVFDRSETITLPLDKVARPIQCLVQVKSTDRQPRKCQIKLSNWVRLVESPLPAFFLVLEFDGMDSCQRAYLVHVGEKYIRRVLKRLRELGCDRGPDLHKMTLQFVYSEDERLSSADGKGLQQAICRHVDSLEAYVAWKLEVLRTVGYEDGKWEINLAGPPPLSEVDVQEYLIDFTLGLIPSIEAKHVEVRDVRFGIPSQEPTYISTQGAVLEITNREPFGDGTILLTTPDSVKQLRLDTQVYLPQGIGFELDQEHFKVRFAAPFIDFIFWPFQAGKADFRYELPRASERYNLVQLQPVSELALLLYNASIRNGRIEFEARIDSGPFCTGYIDVRGTVSKQVADYANAIVCAWTVAKHFDIHHAVKLKPIELLQQELRLIFMASVVSPTQPSARVLYWSSDDPSDGGKSACLPYVTDAVIGQYRMAIAVAIIGQSEATGQTGQENDKFREFRIETRDLRLCRQYLCGRDEAPRYTFRDLAQSVVEEYGDSTHILIAEGINDYLINSQEPGKSSSAA